MTVWFDRVLSVDMFDGMILVKGRHVLTLVVMTFFLSECFILQCLMTFIAQNAPKMFLVLLL